jgi:hypothetical protein
MNGSIRFTILLGMANQLSKELDGRNMRVSTLGLVLLLLSCRTVSPPTETRVTVAVRDGTELFGFKNVPVHLSCGSRQFLTVSTDLHGIAKFRVPRGTTCTVSASVASGNTEQFSQTFVVADRAVTFMLVSKFAYLTEPPARHELPMRAVRVYPDRAPQ